MIKIGFLVSYDYDYLEKAIPCVYEHADIIALAIDINRLTWSGNPIEIPESFFSWIKEIDHDNKIKIYEDNFYVPTNTASENDTRERNLLGKFMGDGGWHIQLDSDEYFINFGSFANYLKTLENYLVNPEKTPVEIQAFWITLFKKVEGGYLYIKDSYDSIEFCTNLPRYKYMRVTNHKKKIFTKYYMLHQSWAREENEVYTKLINWSHKDDSDTMAFFDFWKNLNRENYKEVKNFHSNDPSKWRSLGFIDDEKLFKLEIQISKFNLFKLKSKKRILGFVREHFNKSLQDKMKKFYRIFKSKGVSY